MKALYIKPEIEIIVMLQNEQLLADSRDEIYEGMSKKHSSSFSIWDDEPDNSLPQGKSIWDDEI